MVRLAVGSTDDDRAAVGSRHLERYCSAPGASTDRVILYLHGGGFYVGLTNFYRLLAVELSLLSAMFVLLPDYRLIPEHPFPAALDDCVAACAFAPGYTVMVR